jgi:hypothetical protein
MIGPASPTAPRLSGMKRYPRQGTASGVSRLREPTFTDLVAFQLPISRLRKTFARLRALFSFEGDSHVNASSPASTAVAAVQATPANATAGAPAPAFTEQATRIGGHRRKVCCSRPLVALGCVRGSGDRQMRVLGILTLWATMGRCVSQAQLEQITTTSAFRTALVPAIRPTSLAEHSSTPRARKPMRSKIPR